MMVVRVHQPPWPTMIMKSVGIDIVKVDRVKRLIDIYGEAFTKKIARSGQRALSAESWAARWALREAGRKASGLPFSCISVVDGVPPMIEAPNCRFLSSITHDGGMAVAVAVCFEQAHC